VDTFILAILAISSVEFFNTIHFLLISNKKISLNTYRVDGVV